MSTLPTPQDSAYPSSFCYQVGGSLPVEHEGYVEREADRDLFQHLMAGEYCFVFNSRQMGKSSLRVRAMQKLQKNGVICAVIDPQTRGIKLSEEQWYAGTIKRLLTDIGLAEAESFARWWKDREAQSLSAVERFYEFVSEILLAKTTQKIVIFVEEVDNLLSLTFDTDGFFGLIRSLYEKRGEQNAFQRLTFCFLGVATPYDLIRSHHRSAFNIGHPVEMTGFTYQEALPLLVGLRGRVRDPDAVLRAVLDWSGGQPFLTQKLLKLVTDTFRPEVEELSAQAMVEAVARRNVIENWEGQDVPPHLKTIRDRLLQGEEKGRAVLLQLYQRVLEVGYMPADSSLEQLQLRLTGLVAPRQGVIQVYNPIYAAVFSSGWVEHALHELRPPLFGKALEEWNKAVNSQKNDFLLRSAALAQAEAWAKGRSLTAQEDKFLSASRQLLLQNRENEIKRDEQHRSLIRLRALVCLIGGCAFVAIYYAVEANSHKQRAVATANRLEISEKDARSKELTALANAKKAHDTAELYKKTLRENKLIGDRLGLEKEKLGKELHRTKAASQRADDQTILKDTLAKVLNSAKLLTGTHPLGSSVQAILAVRQLSDHRRIFTNKPSLNNQVIATLLNAINASLEISQLRPSPVNSPVMSIAYSPDGSLLAAGSLGSVNAISLWSLKAGRLLCTADSASSRDILSVAFSPDGSRFASGDKDGNINQWDARDCRSVSPTVKTGVEAWALAYSHNKSNYFLAAAFSEGSNKVIIKQWMAKQPTTMLPRLQGSQGTGITYSISYSLDDQFIAAGGDDKILREWNTRTGIRTSVDMAGNRQEIRALAYNPVKREIATAGLDGKIRIWDPSVGEEKSYDDPNGKVTQRLTIGIDVNSIQYTRDGKELLSVSDDASIIRWNVETGEVLSRAYRGHPTWIPTLALDPQREIFATGGSDGSIRFWRMHSATPVSRDISVRPNRFIPIDISNNKVVYRDADSSSLLFQDMISNQFVQLKLPKHRLEAVKGSTVVYSLPLADKENDVKSFHVFRRGIAKCTFKAPSSTNIYIGKNENHIAAVGSSMAKLIEARSCKKTSSFTLAAGRIRNSLLAFSGRMSIFAYTTPTGVLYVHTPKRQPIRKEVSSFRIQSIDFSEKTNVLVAGGIEKEPDGITAKTQGFIYRWTLRNGKLTYIGTPILMSDNLKHIQLSLDGSRILGTDSDGFFHQWDTITGETIGAPIKAQNSDDTNSLLASYTRSGDHIITVSGRKVLRWNFSKQSLIKIACNAVGKSLGSIHNHIPSPDFIDEAKRARTACAKYARSKNG